MSALGPRALGVLPTSTTVYHTSALEKYTSQNAFNCLIKHVCVAFSLEGLPFRSVSELTKTMAADLRSLDDDMKEGGNVLAQVSEAYQKAKDSVLVHQTQLGTLNRL